jgi:hypothetical protein
LKTVSTEPKGVNVAKKGNNVILWFVLGASVALLAFAILLSVKG